MASIALEGMGVNGVDRHEVDEQRAIEDGEGWPSAALGDVV